ncbi:MAG: peptidylprolyl isomerase [Aquificae bacterium]|nr:peptidylprolyl isomerase [Aquificota bacterium]
MNKYKFLFMLILVLSFSFPSLAEKNKEIQLVDKIVLIINGEPILLSEIELAKLWFKTDDTKKAVEELINLVLVSQQARKLGITVFPDEINEALLKVAKANGFSSLDDFKKKLEKEGIVFSEFRTFVRREILRTKFIQGFVRPKALKGVKEGKIEKVRKVRIIYIDKSKPGYMDKLEQLEKNLTKENFAKMAKKFSDDEFTKDNGGLLGEVRKGELLKILDENIWKHKVGDIFEITGAKGTYFVYIEEEKDIVVPVNEVDEEFMKKLEKEYNLLVKKLRENAYIEYLDPKYKVE